MPYLTGEKTIFCNILWNMPGKSAGSGEPKEAGRTLLFTVFRDKSERKVRQRSMGSGKRGVVPRNE